MTLLSANQIAYIFRANDKYQYDFTQDLKIFMASKKEMLFLVNFCVKNVVLV